MKKIISIFGPTGIGKSSIAIELAKKNNGEIIGVDSRQIYKGVSVGTAQPNQNQLNDFAKFIKKNVRPLAEFEEGRRALIIANAAKKSLSSKKFEKLTF